MAPSHSLAERYRALSPLLEHCSAAIASQDVEAVEIGMARIDGILAEIDGLAPMHAEPSFSPANPNVVEEIAAAIRTVLNEVDAARARLEGWKEQVQASLGHLAVGGQAVDRYAAMSGGVSDELFRLRA